MPQELIIDGECESRLDVTEKFVNEKPEIAKRIQYLLKTNAPIKVTKEKENKYITSAECNLCKFGFSIKNHKVANLDHLSGRFRQILCNTCNLKLQKCIPCFLHNLSNYDAHFIGGGGRTGIRF